jgi:thermolysin
MSSSIKIALAVAAAVASTMVTGSAQQNPDSGLVSISATDAASVREWDDAVQSARRSGDLRLVRARPDTMVAGRTLERYDQYHLGVRVYGGGLTRQTRRGLTTSVFASLSQGLPTEASASLSVDEARRRIAELAGVPADALGARLQPELVWLPLDRGGYALSYRMRALSPRGLTMYFVDARTGALHLALNDLKTQAAVAAGRGVLEDRKKLSVTREGTVFRATDELRPPEISTYDLRGNLSRTIAFLNGDIALGPNDKATNADSEWLDGAAVDGHVYAGFTYDYFFKRFGRRGLDDNNLPILSIVHPVSRADIFSAPPPIIGLFYLNAAYFGEGVMVYGEGLPSTLVDGEGRSWNFTSGALDIVAHELTHGVTDYSSRLVYRNESGALNEAFSDIMAVGAEFFFQPAGSGPRRADYLVGEDVITPVGLRSVADPRSFGDPDHYSIRFRGVGDNGGVHTNSLIASHAFYLAVEGGTNRTSGRRVSGVGAGNRDQIERVFYRAFVDMLPPNATFRQARSATAAAASDLYGSGSPAARAVAQAWSAVGVE